MNFKKVIFSILALLCISLLFSVFSVVFADENVNINIIEQPNSNDVFFTVSSNNVNIKSVEVYKKSADGSYMRFYKSNSSFKEKTFTISSLRLSRETETFFRVVVIDENNQRTSADITADKLPEYVPPASPSTSSSPQVTSSPTPSSTPSSSPSTTPSNSPNNGVLPTKITLNKTIAAVDRTNYKTVQLRATISPSNATSKDIVWTSKNSSIATVNSKGLVTGKNFGTTTITATSKSNGDVKATCRVTVIHPLYEKVELKNNVKGVLASNNKSVNIKKNTTAILPALLKDADGKTYTLKILDGTYKGQYVKMPVSKSNFSFVKYYIQEYSNEVKTAYINNTGISSDTKYLMWISEGSETVTIFKGSKGNWKIVKTMPCSTGDREAYGEGIGYTPRGFNFYVGSKPYDSSYGTKIVHVYRDSNNKTTNNPIHTGYTKQYPQSHGCTRLTLTNLKWLVSNIPINSRVIHY